MPMQSKAFLAEMAAHAREYDFPILDNAYWELISGRVRGFRKAEEFAIVFELLIFQTQAQSFLVNIYAYGPAVGTTQGDVGAYSPIAEVPGFPLWNDEGNWIIDLPLRSVSVNGSLVSVVQHPRHSRGLDQSSEVAMLSDGDSADEGAFGRALARELGLRRLMPDRSVIELLPQLADATEVVRLSNWDHPDVIGGQLPSDSVSITQVAMLLAGETDAVTFDHMHDNVNWRSWGF